MEHVRDETGRSGNMSTGIHFDGRYVSLAIGDNGHFDIGVFTDHRDGKHDGFPIIKVADGLITKDGGLQLKHPDGDWYTPIEVQQWMEGRKDQ
jgi:hypothetical protein